MITEHTLLDLARETFGTGQLLIGFFLGWFSRKIVGRLSSVYYSVKRLARW